MGQGAGGGAPKGNKSAAYPGMWRDALRRACAKDRKAIDEIAMALIKAAKAGDIYAIKEFGDRIDGKAVAHVNVSGTVNLQETFASAVKFASEKMTKNAKPSAH